MAKNGVLFLYKMDEKLTEGLKMKKSNLQTSVLLCSFVLLLMQGCQSRPQQYRYEIVKKNTIVAPPVKSNTEIKTKLIKRLNDAHFEMENLSAEIIDEKTFIVSGRIVNPILTYTCQLHRGKIVAKGSWGTGKVWTTIGSDPKYISKEPWGCRLSIYHSLLSPSANYIKVNFDGSFRKVIKARDGCYFIKPKNTNYGNIKVYDKLNIGASETNYVDSLHGGRGTSDDASCYVPLKNVSIYVYNYDRNKAIEFARSLFRNKKSPVNLEFKEQTTRLSISPEITITSINAPAKKDFISSFKSKLQQEFKNDSVLVNTGMETVNNYIKHTEKSSEILSGEEIPLLLKPIYTNNGYRRDGSRYRRSNTGHQNNPLYEKMRHLRKSLARRDQIRPYHIFTNREFDLILAAMPTNMESMSNITGIDKSKVSKYGADFVKLIKKESEN